MNATAVPCNLAPQGWQDLHELADTFRKNFPTIFNTPYSPENYTFAHSTARRTKQSLEAFVEELFGKTTMRSSEKFWTANDTMLRVGSLIAHMNLIKKL